MSKKKPHIIIFNPDQWRWDVMEHMGNPAAATPNLDAFGKSLLPLLAGEIDEHRDVVPRNVDKRQ